jgi:plasmid stabilization system protein ParE
MKSYRVVWDDDAKKSLREISDFIKKNSPTAARHVRKTLLKLGNGLQRMPERFSSEQYLSRPGIEYRSVSKWSYKIIYRILGDQVKILRVVHTSRDTTVIQEIE